MSNESQGYTGPIPVAVISQAHYEELAREFDAGMQARKAAARAPFNAEAAAAAPSVSEQQEVEIWLQYHRHQSRVRRNIGDDVRTLGAAAADKDKMNAVIQRFREDVRARAGIKPQPQDDAGCCGRCEKPAGDGGRIFQVNSGKHPVLFLEGWTPWEGGECPVHGGTLVRARMRSGVEGESLAGVLRWSYEGTLGDIVAYRVIDAGKKDEPAEASRLSADTLRAIGAKLQEHAERPVSINGAPHYVHMVEPAPTAASFLAAAGECMADRAAEYDSPQGERSIPAVVTAFNAITGHGLTEAEGWAFMSLLKLTRLFSSPTFHRDSAVDGVAYSALTAEARAQEAG